MEPIAVSAVVFLGAWVSLFVLFVIDESFRLPGWTWFISWVAMVASFAVYASRIVIVTAGL